MQLNETDAVLFIDDSIIHGGRGAKIYTKPPAYFRFENTQAVFC